MKNKLCETIYELQITTPDNRKIELTLDDFLNGKVNCYVHYSNNVFPRTGGISTQVFFEKVIGRKNG
jgi:hypothetical protein